MVERVQYQLADEFFQTRIADTCVRESEGTQLFKTFQLIQSSVTDLRRESQGF